MLVDVIKRLLADCTPEALVKIDEKLAQARSNAVTQPIAMAFSLAPRWTGKTSITLDDAQTNQLAEFWPAHPIANWRWDQLARCYILLSASQQLTEEQFEHGFALIYTTSDVGESVLLLQCLPILPHSATLLELARAAARSSVDPIFHALAYHNPYPKLHFDQTGWNQLILKAMFTRACLNNIDGIDERNNPDLVTMLCDYVRERWVADRDVPYDIWRNIGSLASDPQDLDLVARALQHSDKQTRYAAALATRANPMGKSVLNNQLAHDQELNDLLRQEDFCWEFIDQLI